MLRITQQTSSEAAKQYYSSADYYAEGRETAGLWGGEAAKLLGLVGPVARRHFDRLCENRHPITNEPLTARHDTDRTVGYDFTFSAPKSVSVLYALEGDEHIAEAFRGAVRETMREIEQEMKTRVRKGGQNAERVTGTMAWAEFLHLTSRPVGGVPDPQLHMHCFAFNATWDAEERQWKAGQFRDLKRDAPYWQAAFRVRLADRLQDLGYELDVRRDDFEVKGVAPATLRKFARRTAKIEEVAAELGISSPEAKAKLGQTTREGKNPTTAWPELQRAWRERLSDGERKALAAVAPAGHPRPRPPAREAAAMDFAQAHCFERDAVVPEKRLLAAALQAGLGGVTVEGVRGEYRRRRLIVQEHDGRRFVTTPDVLAEERRLLDFARKGRGIRKSLAPQHVLRRKWLNAGQQAAVRHILNSPDRVILVRGAAGTGKTTLMQEAVEAITEAGRRVVVLAPTAAASFDVLRGEGFADAATVASFLRDPHAQAKARDAVVWVDEAGLLGTRDLAALFDAAGRVNARVVLMGDRRQHSSVPRGTPLLLLEEEAGLPVAEVTEIRRQKRAEYKAAVGLLSEGKTAEGFDALDRLGWVIEAPAEERYRRLAEDYLGALREGKSALVIAPTHAEGQRITAEVRNRLRAEGKLGEERTLPVWAPLRLTEAERGEASSYHPGDMLQLHRAILGHKAGERLLIGEAVEAAPLQHADRFSAYRPATLSLAAGDRVRVTVNGRTKDGKHRLNNGALFTLQGFTARGDLVLDNGWVVDRDFGHLVHGVCVTSHASQGKTVDRVFLAQSAISFPASGREQFYVSTSRAREQTVVYTDDRRALREAIGRADTRLTATDLARHARQSFAQRLRRHLSFLRRVTALDDLRDAGPSQERARTAVPELACER